MAMQRLSSEDSDDEKDEKEEEEEKGKKAEEEEEEESEGQVGGSWRERQRVTGMVLGCTGNGKSYTLNMTLALTRMLLFDVCFSLYLFHFIV